MALIQGDFLLVNNNNTRTKLALARGGDLVAETALTSRGLSAAGIAAAIEGWRFGRAVAASVVPACLPEIRSALEGTETLEISCRAVLGVEIDFPDPSSIGADRLANAAAVAESDPGEFVVVVDFGTAVTFDIVDRRPAYVGGVIAPGLDAMRHYLRERTALLPEIDLVRPRSAVGKTTVAAMQAGAYFGYRGLVRGILEAIRQETGEHGAKVIATGGYAALIAGEMPEVCRIDPTLTMRGLLRAARLNFRS